MKRKLTKEEFVEILNFLSVYVGLTDLGDGDMQEELWDHYLKGYID